MNNATQTLATSENEINEIKINMTFEEAVEITQETYNNYQENADNDLNNLDIQKFQNIKNQKGNFKLYHKFHDKNSNFSGMTYIYEEENAVNVAIACRGSVFGKGTKNAGNIVYTENKIHIFNQNRFDENLKDDEILDEFLSSIFSEEAKKDWLRNNWGMLWNTNTDSDNFAKKYVTKILEKINRQYIKVQYLDKQIKIQYIDKQINIITLGHSKGGREAQKQMISLLNDIEEKTKEKQQQRNIYCLTFNSAFCSKEDNQKHYNKSHTNLFLYNKWYLGIDPLYIINILIAFAIFMFFSWLILWILLGFCKSLMLTLISILFCVIYYIILFPIKKQCKMDGVSTGMMAIIFFLSNMLATVIYIMEILLIGEMQTIGGDWIQLSIPTLITIVFIVLLYFIIRLTSKLGKNCGKNVGYEVESPSIDILNSHSLKSFLKGKLYANIQSCNLNEALEKLANQKDTKKS